MQAILKLKERVFTRTAEQTVEKAKEQVSCEQSQALGLIEQIRQVKQQLDDLETIFNNSSDGDLIESCIYRQNALHAQYRFLLSQSKTQGVTCKSEHYALTSGRKDAKWGRNR